MVKIFLFFFFFAIHFTINALFFNDSTVHQIYEDKGAFNFIYQIPQVLLSSIISGLISCVIRYLSLTQKIIIRLKQVKENNKKNLKKNKKKTLNSIKINITIFFILSLVLLLFCLFYISCFCGIYEHSQLHLIKDSILSFLVGLIYPIFLCLIQGMLRMSALKDKKRSSEKLYKLSSLLMMII